MKTNLTWAALCVLLLAPHAVLTASDHIDGPVTISHPVADITDLFVFPSPNRPGHLTMILNVYTGVAVDGHFSDKVTYSFLVRQARIEGTGQEAFFQTSGDYRVSCTFETPHGFNAQHHVTCKSSTGSTLRVAVDEIVGPDAANALRVYAGRRSDPFYFNAGWAVAASTKGKLEKDPKNSNVMQNMNVLSVVVEIDLEKELGALEGSLLAVAAETTTTDGAGSATRRIDRVGRPEITNFSLVPHDGKDLRDPYNAAPSFDLAGTDEFRDRLRENIDWYDKIDDILVWPTSTRNHLAEILVNDFQVVDVSKPFADKTYFEIEMSLLMGTPHTTCGGRVPNEDVMDVIYTLLINGGQPPQISDGVDAPTRWSTDVFPYLAEPNDGLVSAVKSFVGRAAGKLTVAGRLRWLGVLQLLAGLFAVIAFGLVIIYGVKQLIASFRQREIPAKKRAGCLVIIAVCFGLASLCGLITGAFSYGGNGILALFCVGAVVLFLKTKPPAAVPSTEPPSDPPADASGDASADASGEPS